MLNIENLDIVDLGLLADQFYSIRKKRKETLKNVSDKTGLSIKDIDNLELHANPYFDLATFEVLADYYQAHLKMDISNEKQYLLNLNEIPVEDFSLEHPFFEKAKKYYESCKGSTVERKDISDIIQSYVIMKGQSFH